MMKSTQQPRFARATVHRDNEACRNCMTVFCGSYCPGCGQEALTGAPTAMGFIYEFLTRNILERGKLPKTLWQLLCFPGSLTVDFLEGRRQRSIRPVRLYFGLSLLYFLLLSFTSNFSHEFAKNFGDNVDGPNSGALSQSEPAQQKQSQDMVASPPSAMQPKVEVATKDLDLDRKLNQIFPTDVAAELKRRINRYANLPERQAIQAIADGMMQQIPKAMFFLLPVFALILKCLFLTRPIPYGAHLLFAFHYHAMLFVCLLVLLLPMPERAQSIIVLWACLYLPLAMRKTYDSGWWSTLWRCLMLSMLYLLAIGLALLGALAATVLF